MLAVGSGPRPLSQPLAAPHRKGSAAAPARRAVGGLAVLLLIGLALLAWERRWAWRPPQEERHAAAAEAAGRQAARDVELAVDWPAFLGKHDLQWDWEWGTGGASTIEPRSQDLHACGASRRCCLAAAAEGGGVQLAECADAAAALQWRAAPAARGATLINVATGQCLSAGVGGSVVLAACGSPSGQVWADYSGYLLSVPANDTGADGQCLSIATGADFCDGTICPFALSHPFTTGMQIAAATCQNGDRSQMFALRTVPAAGEPSRQNLVPLTWAVAAYVGNGLLGLRVQSEEGSTGVLRLLLDNVRLGAGGQRKPSGYFRLVANAKNLPLRVVMRQQLHSAVLVAKITDTSAGAVALSLTCFASADLEVPAVACQVAWDPALVVGAPELQWVGEQSVDVAWANDTVVSGFNLYAAVGGDCAGAGCVGDAHTAVARAKERGVEALLAGHRRWWEDYWPQSFVSIPTTRLEGYYYVQLYRFPSSERVALHGLMGAFGPTDNYNLWPDYVWDMNQQVMYWIAPASNRPVLSDPMLRYLEADSFQGGLWMFHNYVKQADFEGRDDLLRDVAWAKIVGEVEAEAGKTASSPGALTLVDGVYHYGIGTCGSPEYTCFPPFEHLQCGTKGDCNFGLSQLRWGLAAALSLTSRFGLQQNLSARGVDAGWWQELLGGKLVWYPTDDSGFRLDANCAFLCPHRHFSHLLQMYDLETVDYDPSPAGNASLNKVLHASLDTWYRITCNASNWFNEECRGFTQCGLAAMSAVTGRPDSAAGNLTGLVDSVVTPNGMYGEMVYFTHPDEFAPVAESAYCGAGVLHTMLLHTSPRTGVLSIFAGVPDSWRDLAFHQLRAASGLLVSAVRRDGRTLFLRLVRSSDGPQLFRIAEEAWCEGLAMDPPSTPIRRVGADCLWEVNLTAGSHVLLYPDLEPVPDFTIAPVSSNASEHNWFGYRREMQPLH